VKKLALTLTVSCVVLTNVGVPALTPSNNTCVLVLKFSPVKVTRVVAAPTLTAPGVTELKAATDGGTWSVN